MTTITLDGVLDIVEQLPIDQQKMLEEILHQRNIIARRYEIALDAKHSLELFNSGKLKPQTAQEVIAALKADLNK